MFQINGKWWKIEYVHPQDRRLMRADGTMSIAACDNNSKTIYINYLVNGDLLRKVLCHEVTHAAMFSYGIFLTLEQEELLADLLATYGDEIITIANKVFYKLRRGA